MNPVEISYEDLKPGRLVRVIQEYEDYGPAKGYRREYVGRIVEASAKWLKIERDGIEMVVPQSDRCMETIYVQRTRAERKRDVA